jgi:hypothetical protein
MLIAVNATFRALWEAQMNRLIIASAIVAINVTFAVPTVAIAGCGSPEVHSLGNAVRAAEGSARTSQATVSALQARVATVRDSIQRDRPGLNRAAATTALNRLQSRIASLTERANRGGIPGRVAPGPTPAPMSSGMPVGGITSGMPVGGITSGMPK